MNNATAQHLAQLAPFERLLRDAYERGEVALQIYHDGVFDEEQFLVSGRMSILERQGLVSLSETKWGLRPSWTNHQMHYELTPQGRRLVETVIIAEAQAGEG